MGALALRTQNTSDIVTHVERAAVAALQALLDADLVLILRWLPDQNMLSLEGGTDSDGWLDSGMRFPVEAFAKGADALRSTTPVVVQSLAFDADAEPMIPLNKHGVSSGILTSIRGDGESWGIVAAYAREMTEYSADDLHFVRGVANAVAWAIAYHRAQGTLENLIEDSPDPVARFDPEMRVEYANPAMVMATGHAAKDLVGRTFRDLQFVEPQLDGLEALVQAVFRGRRERQADFCLSSPLGERYYRVRLIPELATDRSVRSVLIVARDDTEHKKVADERAVLQHELIDRDRRHEELVQKLLVEQQRSSEQVADANVRAEIVKQLTARETDILRLLAGGLTNRQIARRLHLSPGTVRNHLGRVFPKLDAIDRTQAAVRAVELGLIASEAA